MHVHVHVNKWTTTASTFLYIWMQQCDIMYLIIYFDADNHCVFSSLKNQGMTLLLRTEYLYVILLFFSFSFLTFLKRSEYLFHHYWFVSGFVQILIQDVSSSHWAACSRSTEGSETDNFLLHRVSCWALHGLWDKRRAGMIGNNETILIYWRLTLSSKNGLWEILITHCDWEMV